MKPQEIVERVLAGPGGAGRAVLVTQTSEAVLRWANSTMTTNGHTTAQDVAVVALEAVEGGTAVGVVGTGAPLRDPAAVDDLVAAARRAARDAGPTRDVAPLPEPGGDDPAWIDGPVETSIGVFARLVDGLAGVLDSPERHYGFASHELTTVWLGTSTGVRRRWVQPTGSIELNVKTPQLDGSAWTGCRPPTSPTSTSSPSRRTPPPGSAGGAGG